jgi:hypothetical protein
MRIDQWQAVLVAQAHAQGTGVSELEASHAAHALEIRDRGDVERAGST